MMVPFRVSSRPSPAGAAPWLFVVWFATLFAATWGSTAPAADWPYQRLARPNVPAVETRDWGRNPLDAFVLARLERAHLRPAAEADKLTLLKRVTYDLTGLMPSEDERTRFLADASPDAYERLVERLLDSPRFGERWAQHWLDVVRYAETEGYKLDLLRPEAYRYRDYVIQAFNADLPYDRFVSQQIAGDEIDPEDADSLIATGFYRLHPEESSASNYKMVRQEILDNITDVFGATFLGLTVGCARCHDHKFDPVTEEDYYALQAFFAPVVGRDDLPIASETAERRYQEQMVQWEEATREIRAEIETLLEPVRKQLFEELIVVFDEETQKALRTPEAERDALQIQLASLASKQMDRRFGRMHRRLEGKQRARYDELQTKLAEFDSMKPAPLPMAMAVVDAGPVPPETHVLEGGDYQKPGDETEPEFPEFLAPAPPVIRPPKEHPGSTGRRSALAEWLVTPDHPLTARVMVNRLWQHYFGRGIVATPNDFGQMGAPVTHPELLDYLASELVENGWSLKSVHRLIVTSAAYRQSSDPSRNPTAEAAEKSDPENNLLWHMRIRRRDGESVRDLVLQASGELNLRMFGPSAQPELPPAVLETSYAWEPDPRVEDRNRRSIYVLAKRNLADPLLGAFDQPDRTNSCPTRSATITAPQALVRLNGEFMLAQAERIAAGVAGRPAIEQIENAFRRVLGREPHRDEAAAAAAFLQRQRALAAASGDEVGSGKAEHEALLDLCHALLNSAELLYVE